MRIIKRISENEMVAVFLKAEIYSLRFQNNILHLLQTKNFQRDIIDHPNLHDPVENAARKQLLTEFRGYKINDGVFKDFPKTEARQLAERDQSNTRIFETDEKMRSEWGMHLNLVLRAGFAAELAEMSNC